MQKESHTMWEVTWASSLDSFWLMGFDITPIEVLKISQHHPQIEFVDSLGRRCVGLKVDYYESEADAKTYAKATLEAQVQRLKLKIANDTAIIAGITKLLKTKELL